MNKKKQKEARERANQLLGQLATGDVANKDINMACSDDDDEADDNDTGILILIVLIDLVSFNNFCFTSRMLL